MFCQNNQQDLVANIDGRCAGGMAVRDANDANRVEHTCMFKDSEMCVLVYDILPLTQISYGEHSSLSNRQPVDTETDHRSAGRLVTEAQHTA